MKKIILIITIILSGTFVQTVKAQELAKAQALFVYNFAKFIDWPESQLNGEFVIGVVGNSDVYNEIVSVSSGKKLRNLNIVVKKMNKTSDLSSCNVIFICENESSNLATIVNYYKNSPTLIITERQGLIHKGSCISFRLEDDKLRYEISKKNFASRGLAIDKRLEQMAAYVD
jgi:hypothetical protein